MISHPPLSGSITFRELWRPLGQVLPQTHIDQPEGKICLQGRDELGANWRREPGPRAQRQLEATRVAKSISKLGVTGGLPGLESPGKLAKVQTLEPRAPLRQSVGVGLEI